MFTGKKEHTNLFHKIVKKKQREKKNEHKTKTSFNNLLEIDMIMFVITKKTPIHHNQISIGYHIHSLLGFLKFFFSSFLFL